MPFTSETAHTGTQFKPGQSGNPAGKPKGTKHISTYIQEAMEDENFETMLLDAKKGYVEYKGMPIKAIIKVAVAKAAQGDKDMMNWLASFGYSKKIEQENTGEQTLTIVTRKYGDNEQDD